jgi:hypothetical protein
VAAARRRDAPAGWPVSDSCHQSLSHACDVACVHAEVRDHLLSLIVFPAASKLPVCVFMSGEGQLYSWDCERKQRAIADVSRVACELAAMVMPRRQLLSLDGEG